jgi:hypothetical protein
MRGPRGGKGGLHEGNRRLGDVAWARGLGRARRELSGERELEARRARSRRREPGARGVRGSEAGGRRRGRALRGSAARSRRLRDDAPCDADARGDEARRRDADPTRSGYACTAGKCTPQSYQCVDDQTSRSASATGDAGVTDCAPYICNQSPGTCVSSCSSVSDCISPAVCNASGQCVAPPGSSSSGGSGGGCAVVPGASSDASFWALAGLGLLVSRRRPRNPSRSPRRLQA